MQKVVSQVELSFWDWYIQILSHSEIMRRIIPFFYRLSRKQLTSLLVLCVGVSSAGFVVGILLARLIS